MRAAFSRLLRRIPALIAAGLRLSGALLQVLSAVVVARVATIDTAGHYFIGFAAATLLATLCRAGFDQALTRLVASDLVFGRVDAARDLCRQLARRFLLRCAWITPLLLAACFIVKAVPDWHAHAGLADALIPFVLAAPLLGVAMLSGMALQAARRAFPSVMAMFYVHNALVMGAALLPATWIEAGAFDWSFLAGSALAALIGQILLARTWRVIERNAVAEAVGESVDRNGELRSLVGDNAWTVICHLALTWGPLVLLGALSSPTEAAHYGIAARCAQLVSFALPALNFVLAPRFAALCATRQHQRLRRTLLGSLLLSGLLSSVVAMPLIGWATPVMAFFGAAYAGSAATLILLSLAQWAHGAAGAAIQYLAMTGAERALRNRFIFTASLALPAGIALVWTRGAVGAALLTLGSALLLSTLCVLLSLRRLEPASPVQPVSGTRASHPVGADGRRGEVS